MSEHQNAPKQAVVPAALPGDWRTWRIALGISAALSFASLYYLITWADGTGVYLGHFARGWLIRMLPVAVMGLAAAWVAVSGRLPLARLVSTLVNGLWNLLRRLGWVNLVLFAALPYGLLRILWSPQVELIERSLPRAWIAGHLTLLGGIFWLAAWRRGKPGAPLYWTAAAGSLLLSGVYLKVLAFVPDVSNFPFRLDWSETSRYYYASQYFAQSLYGVKLPLPVLHPSRYLLQSLPFLIPSLPLWFHRLWQVILWLGLTGLGGWTLARRLNLRSAVLIGLVTAWAGLFFFQGAVYYHLMVCAILVLWGFDRERPIRSTIFVLIASLWAGISRVNWLPMPGVIAAVLYILETPSAGKKFFAYWSWPVGWVLAGSLVGYGAQLAYTHISGNPLSEFGSSLASDLLWYRLYPNPTYPPGILRAIGEVSAPLLLVFLYRLVRSPRGWQALRWLALFVLLAGMFAGGIVVSVKIGGGADLHNMDAFLVLLAVVGAYLIFDRFAPDDAAHAAPFRLCWPLVALALFVPILPTLNLAQPAPRVPPAVADQKLAVLQSYLDQVSGDPRDVLFISDRHLITFGLVHGVRIVDDYEKVFLMEMAMANNQEYLQKYRDDLDTHRFSLIISEGMGGMVKDQSYQFAEENNAWLERVGEPLLADYTPVADLDPIGLVIYAPKP